MSRIDDLDLDEKRLARRQKRRKSQIQAFIVLGVCVLLIAGVIGTGIHFLKEFINDRAARKAEEQAASIQASLEAQNTVIETPEENEEVQEMSQTDLLDEIVSTCISEMPLEDKVAGLFIITPEQLTGVDTAVKAGSGTQSALTTYAVGGIVYSGKNIKSEDQITDMLGTTASMSKYPIFTVVSEDGSDRGAITSSIGLEGIGTMTDPDLATSAAQAIGNTLFQYKFNFNIAPLTDLSESSPFGTDPEAARGTMASFVTGMEESGITTCMSMFPASLDTKAGMAVDDRSAEDLQAQCYGMFTDAIATGHLNAVMVSNGSFPSIASDNTPASLSKEVIEGQLRGDLGFGGIVITAPLNEGAITEYYTSEQAVVEAIKAGADMLYLPEDFEAAYQGLLEAVQSGKISEERIDESLARIYRVKYADRVDQITEGN